MKNLYFLLTAGCMVFSQAQADTAYKSAQTKSQVEGRFLTAFWGETQFSHAFVDAFSDSEKTLKVGESGSVHIVDGVANASSNQNQTFSASIELSTTKTPD